MTESKRKNSRQKVCFCSWKSFRLLASQEKQKLNSNREEKIDFEKDCFPVGVCKKCEIAIRVSRPIQIAFWEDHAKGGLPSVKTCNTLSFYKNQVY